jgi:hypothetical protein
MSDNEKFNGEDFLEMLLKQRAAAEIKKQYAEGLNYDELVKPTNEEMALLHNYFIDFSVVQLLKLYSVSTYKEKSNFFLNEFVNLFISNMKRGMLQKMEIDELTGEHAEMEELVGKELMDKERDIARKKATLLLDTFETNIKEVLDIKDEPSEMSDDELNLF